MHVEIYTLVLEDKRFTVYEDEREVIATYVSTSDLQRQSHKDKVSLKTN